MSDPDPKAGAPRKKEPQNGKIDEELEESFPASDPPAFMGGDVIGAPKRRESPSPGAVKTKK